jgi:hypothetical protein
MTIPTAAQMNLLRRQPVRTKCRMVIYEPNTMLACQVNKTTDILLPFAVGTMEIPYNRVTQGYYGLVSADLVVYFGSAAGKRDLGRSRVRSITADTITIAPNNFELLNNTHITITDYIEPVGVHPRVIMVGNDPVFYKDYDIAYTDQNRNMDPVVCMGANRVCFAGESIDWHSSGSYSPCGASLVRWAWILDGTAEAISYAEHPGPLQYNTPGFYKTELAILDNRGKQFRGYRYVAVLDGPEDGIRSWGVESIDGDRSQGGWRANVWVREDVSNVVEGALVMIVAEDWYGIERTPVSIPNNIVMQGYIEGESISHDYKSKRVKFTILGLVPYVGNIETLGDAMDAVDSDGAAGDWTKMANITVDKGLVHYLRWHTTLLRIADFHPTNDTKKKRFFDITHGPIQKAVSAYLEQNLRAAFVSDRGGALWAEIDHNLVPAGNRALPSAPWTLDKQDWRGQPEIVRVISTPLSHVEMGGVAYTGIGENYTPYLAEAPSSAPLYVGSPDNVEGLVLESQVLLNELVGNYLADANNEFPEVTHMLSRGWRFFDIAPWERVYMNLTASDTYLGLIWVERRFLPYRLSHTWDSRKQLLTTDLTMKAETDGVAGATITIPTDPPDGGGTPPPGGGGFPAPPPLNTGGPGLVYALSATKLFRTRDFSSVSPTWEELSLPAAAARDLVLDPHDPQNSAWLMCAGSVWYTSNLNASVPTWTVKLNNAISLAQTGQAYDALEGINLHASVLTPGVIYSFSGGGFSVMYYSSDYGTTWTRTKRNTFVYYSQWMECSDYDAAVGWNGLALPSVESWSANGQTRAAPVVPPGAPNNIHNWVAQLFKPYEGASGGPLFGISNRGSSDTDGYFWVDGVLAAGPVIPGQAYHGVGAGQYCITGKSTGLYVAVTPPYTYGFDPWYIFHSAGPWNAPVWELRCTLNITDLETRWGGCLGLWPFDENQVFFMVNDTGKGPMYSTDGGYNFVSKRGNLDGLIGGNWSDLGQPKVLVPVWTVPV